jgi:hypothetical protein
VTSVTGATVNDGQGAGTIQFDDNPTSGIYIVGVSQSEGNTGTTSFNFTVSLTAPTGLVSFDIATADGTATAASGDYVAKSLTGQIIPAGSTSYTFSVAVNGDTSGESIETFVVNLTNVSGASITASQATGMILNDDAPSLSVNNVTQSEGNAATTNFNFTVSLSSPAPAGGVTFNIATADGTATAASGDYVIKSLTSQSIPAWSSTYTFTVQVKGDTSIEPTETFFVNVSNVTGATIADGQGQGTIINDEP